MGSMIILGALGITALVALLLSGYAWFMRQRTGRVAAAVALMIATTVWWLLAYMLEIALADPAAKLFAYRAKFLGIVLVPVAWLVTSLYYSGRGLWLARVERFAALLAVPALTTLLIWTNDLHRLMWVTNTLVEGDGLAVYVSMPAPWFWVHTLYSYALLAAGAYLLGREFAGAPQLYRMQLVALFVSLIFPLAANIVSVFGTTPIDYTPFGFAVTGVTMTLALLRYRLLDIMPIARDRVIESMTDGVIVLDAQERIIDLNSSARRILMWERLEVVGQPITKVSSLLASQPEIAERFRTRDDSQEELVIEREDMVRYLDVRGSALRDAQGRLNGWVVMLRDVTERKLAETHIQAQNAALLRMVEALKIAREQAEESTRLKSEFLATMSHELRTPLNSIIGYTELQIAGVNGALNDKQMDYQERVLANAQHLLGLINEVLDLSKIEAGRMELQWQPLAVDAWLQGLVVQHQVLAQRKGLDFQVRHTPLPKPVVADVERLKQVAVNLLSNAVKFTETGFVRVEVKPLNECCWQLVVSDSGIGIPAEARNVIFEEFRQLDGSFRRRYQGTGLGLAIVRRLVQMHGGDIELDSTIGQGTTFTVTLPYEPEAPVMTPQP